MKNYTVRDCIGIAISYAICAIYVMLLLLTLPFALAWLWLTDT